MANISSYLEEKLLNHIFRNTAYTSPSTVYIGLVDDTATDADLEGGDLTNEITGYTGDRKAVSFTAPTQVSGKGTIENDSEIDFNDMPSTNVGYAIVCDSATEGNILYWCPANTVKSTNAGDIFRLEVGDITLDLD